MVPHFANVPEISAEEAATLVRGGALLIDVREQVEWDHARIPGAVLKPLSEINDWYADLPRDETVVIYCRSGLRSARVIDALMTQAGFDNLFNLGGGIIAWSAAELPIAIEPNG